MPRAGRFRRPPRRARRAGACDLGPTRARVGGFRATPRAAASPPPRRRRDPRLRPPRLPPPRPPRRWSARASPWSSARPRSWCSRRTARGDWDGTGTRGTSFCRSSPRASRTPGRSTSWRPTPRSDGWSRRVARAAARRGDATTRGRRQAAATKRAPTRWMTCGVVWRAWRRRWRRRKADETATMRLLEKRRACRHAPLHRRGRPETRTAANRRELAKTKQAIRTRRNRRRRDGDARGDARGVFRKGSFETTLFRAKASEEGEAVVAVVRDTGWSARVRIRLI